MALPMTYLERKLRGDSTLVVVEGRIYEPDYLESDDANFLKLGSTKTALIDGPSGSELEDLWEAEYRKDISEFIEDAAKKITPDILRGTSLEAEILKTELKNFIVFKVFRKFVAEQGTIIKALGRVKSEYKVQEDSIQKGMKKHMKGEIDETELRRYGLKPAKEELPEILPIMDAGSRVRIRRDSRFASQTSEIGTLLGNFGSEGNDSEGSWAKVRFSDGYENAYREIDLELAESQQESAARGNTSVSSIGRLLARRLGTTVSQREDAEDKLKSEKENKKSEKEDLFEESIAEIAEEKDRESVFSSTFNFNMLIIDDLVYTLQSQGFKKRTFLKVNGRNYTASSEPMMQIYDLVDIYRANLEKKYKDIAFFSQPRLKKLKEMQSLIAEELERPVYKEKMLEIAEGDRPDVMWAIMGFDEFVNRGSDGKYYLFPPGKIAVKVGWNDGTVINSLPVNWGDYYAPNIPDAGKTQSTLCIAGYNNEGKRMSREEKIADYLAHAVRTMQHGYRSGEVNVYHPLRADNARFRNMLISEEEMKKKGLEPLNIG